MPDRMHFVGLGSSLRLRLPLLFAVPVVLVLASFLWITQREIERALIEAGRERAELAATELARALDQGLGAALAETVGMAETPVVRAFVTDTAAADRDAVRDVIVTPQRNPLRRDEVWDTAGRLLFEAATPAPDTAPGLQSFPRTAPPAQQGITPFEAVDSFPFFAITAAVRGDSTAGAPVIGYVRRFARMTSATAERIRRLVGQRASFRIGTLGQPVWTDLDGIVEAPRGRGRDVAGKAHTDAGGVAWIGEIAVVHGTPWVVWVGFPRSAVVAPAEPFMRRMVVVSLLLVAAGLLLVTILGYRLARPLRALLNAANRIATGDLSQRVAIDRPDEIGRLGDAFNAMAERVQSGTRALRENNERIQFALATAGIAIWSVVPESGEMTVSDSMKLVHPGMPDEGVRRWDDFLALVDEANRPAMADVLAGRPRRGDVFDIRYRTRGQEGAARFVEGRAQILRDADGKPLEIIGVSIDVTERQRLQSQLAQSQKMEGIGHLAGGIAHDFNNLLTAILGHARLILTELPEDAEELREDALGIVSAGESAADLTRQLLTFSRQRVVEPRVIDINAQIAQTERLLRRLIGEHIAIETEFDPDLAPILLDPGSLEQVLINLAVNARDAMPDGGTLTISTANVQIEPGFTFEQPDVRPGAYVSLSVRDTGIGMDEKTLAHVFEPFFTTKPVGRGTGLGLATVFGIVKQAAGQTFVYSEPGIGSVFKLYFPAAQQALVEEPATAPDGEAQDYGGSETILVVEDNAHVRDVVRGILERVGYAVHVAKTGEEALEIVSHAELLPDLVVSDVIMPGMTGVELAERLKERYPDIGVILTSGYAGQALRSRRLSTAELIEKPYSPIDLCRKVREILDGDRSS